MTARNWHILIGTTSALALAIVPATAFAQDASAVAVVEPETEEVVVTAIQRSFETSQSIKQESDQIVDSIVAEDIGKLPDVTAAESLARITGVQVDYSQGEAAGTRVRGLPDLTTTYNGREIFTAQGRSVALQDFPAANIARIDVYKSGSANLVEAGIAGLVDVRSRRPLDFKGDRIAGGIAGVHWYQSQKIGLDANLLVSKRWETGIGDIGFLIEGSYTDINFLDSARTVSQTILERSWNGQTIRYPSFVNVDYPTANRWRPSVAAALQWRPSNELEFYADFLFQGFRGDGSGRNFQINSGAQANLSNVEFFPGTNLVKSMTATAGGFPNGRQNAIGAVTDTYQAGGGFIWKRDGLRISGDVAFTDSTYTQHSMGMNFTVTGVQPTRDFDFDTDIGAGGGVATIRNFNLFDPARYRITRFSEDGVRNHGRDVQARLDLDYKLGAQGITNLQAGIRFNTRDVDSRNYARGADAPAGRLYTLLPLEFESAAAGFRNDPTNITRTFLTPSSESILAQADYLRTLVNLPTGRPEFGDPNYTGTEKGYAGYLQARYAFDLGGMTVDGLAGIRAVRTDYTINGITRVDGGIVPVTETRSYEDYLPNVSARLHFTPNLQLRLAYTETRTRPGFGELNPSLVIGIETPSCSVDPNNPDTGPGSPNCYRLTTGGNPDLRPIESQNYDASLEWYFSRSGSITIGAFHRDVTGFISNFTSDIEDPEYGRLRVTRPFNGGEGRLRGFEAGFRTFLRFPGVPQWARNFGVLANYTYIDHETELAQELARTLPGRQPIAGVSSHIANASVFYENRLFSTRLSYNYRSEFTASYGQVPANHQLPAGEPVPTLPVIEDGRGSLDLNGSINPTDNITLTFSISNLTGAARTNRRIFNAEGQSYPWQTRFIESVYRLGIRFRF